MGIPFALLLAQFLRFAKSQMRALETVDNLRWEPLPDKSIDNLTLSSTFASVYSNEVSLSEVLDPDAIAAFGRKATGEKYLICPQK